VVSLVRNGGTTFNALNRDPAALRNLINAGETTFSTAAANQNALAEIFHIFPTFLTQQRLTMTALKSFSLNADPVIRELIPVARQLGPTLGALKTLSPYLRHLFVKLGPLITVSQTGLPATERVLKGLGPNRLLDAMGPFLGQLNPILNWLGFHQQLISDFITDGGASFFARTTSFGNSGTGHYLRQFGPTGPETLSFQPTRDPNNRGNTYPAPLWLPSGSYAPQDFGNGNLPAWDCRNTGAGGNGTTSGSTGQTGQPQPEQPCWVQPPIKGAPGKYKIPRLYKSSFSSK
jgi:ABC-type transporter Mla subunit MlaD